LESHIAFRLSGMPTDSHGMGYISRRAMHQLQKLFPPHSAWVMETQNFNCLKEIILIRRSPGDFHNIVIFLPETDFSNPPLAEKQLDWEYRAIIR